MAEVKPSIMDLLKTPESYRRGQLIRMKLVGEYSLCIRFCTKEEFALEIDRLAFELPSAIFNIGSFYLSKYLPNKHKSDLCDYINSFNGSAVLCDIYFCLNLETNNHTPTIKISRPSSKMLKHNVKIDTFVFVDFQKDIFAIHESLCDSLKNYFNFYRRALLYVWDVLDKPPRTLYPHNFSLQSDYITVLYPCEINEDLEYSWRQSFHHYMKIPPDTPVFRRGQAMHSVPKLCKWLGPNTELLVCPHEFVKMPSDDHSVYLVKGRYTYKHYLQDSIDDKNWGCAYRSLQTLISWLMWQGEIKPHKIPSINEIQASLVRVGDKPKTFIGSRQWIGSLEVSFCLQEMYSIQCRLLPVPKGSQMGQVAGAVLAQHFADGGGPVMVGGGQLAHTIVGIHLPQAESATADGTLSPKYLILDPHFTGPSGCLKTVLSKGWCGWKAHNFWKPDVHYNLCLVPAIRPGRV